MHFCLNGILPAVGVWRMSPEIRSDAVGVAGSDMVRAGGRIVY